MAASGPFHPRRCFGGQPPEIRISLIEGEQSVILALDDERWRLDGRQDHLKTRLIQEPPQRGIRFTSRSGGEIAPTQLGVQSTGERISWGGSLAGLSRSPASVGEQQ